MATSNSRLGRPPQSSMNEEVRILRTKRFAMQPMTVEEAVLQMERWDTASFVFQCRDGRSPMLYISERTGIRLIDEF